MDAQIPRLKELYGSDKDVVLFSVELFSYAPDYLDAKETFKQKNMDITLRGLVSYE